MAYDLDAELAASAANRKSIADAAAAKKNDDDDHEYLVKNEIRPLGIGMMSDIGTPQEPFYTPEQLQAAREKRKQLEANAVIPSEPLPGLGASTGKKVESTLPVAQNSSALPSTMSPASQGGLAQKISSPSSGSDYGYGNISKGLQEEYEANKKLYGVQAEGAKKIEKKLSDDAIDNTLAQDAKETYMADFDKKDAEAQKDIDNSKITSPDIWGNATTGGKVLLALGALFSAATPQSAQAFRNGIENAINRDIDLQKNNLATKKEKQGNLRGLYAMNLARFKDADLARMMSQEQYLKLIGAQIDEQSLGAKTDAAKAAFDKGKGLVQFEIGKIQDAKGEKLMELAAKHAESRKLNSSEEQRLDYLKMGTRAMNDLKTAWKNGDNTLSLVGDNNFTLAANQAAEAFGRMQSGGAINKDEEKRFLAMLPRMTDSKEIQERKIEKMNDIFNERYQTLGLESPSDIYKSQLLKADYQPLPMGK